MPFFPRFGIGFLSKPTICYCDSTIGRFLTSTTQAGAAEYLAKRETAFKESLPKLPSDTDFLLVVPWADDNGVEMMDVWIQSQLAAYGPCGPKGDNWTARGDRLGRVRGGLHDDGIRCGNTTIIAGLEEIHRRKVTRLGSTIFGFVVGKGPEIPAELELITPWSQ